MNSSQIEIIKSYAQMMGIYNVYGKSVAELNEMVKRIINNLEDLREELIPYGFIFDPGHWTYSRLYNALNSIYITEENKW